jgi:hypothetical protein
MMTLELTETEAKVLAEILALFNGDLRMEIAGTDSSKVREYLKEKEVCIKGIIERLPKA